ncbi:DUF1330 domain-containing protein [Rhizobiales bacterium]|uniref:DUF1330 domain-containing protein n=1 Tax=Hongsoonwoonella zoysiae TaxID=2821844 RepID=UPI0015617285|nr:DUF1330 domain-containing protein [Hongsoonwoonella zoysiae]NRG17939.1 DUF1330 domain-containing protein [Hongsoonwoonella zoysiae]
MSAFFVSTVSVKDTEKFQEYSRKAGETFAPFGGQLVIRGAAADTIAGKCAAHQAVGIVKFPNQETLMDWFQSPAYQELIPLREEAADLTITTYVMPA